MPSRDLRGLLGEAIEGRRIVRVAYVRQSDGVLSLHHLAPIDIRPGDTLKTSRTQYLWAWCFEEGKAETLILDRIQRVLQTEEVFSPGEVLGSWATNWPMPDSWIVPRD